MSQENLQFLDYLQSDTWTGFLVSNKIKLYTETDNIFIENVNNRDSIYNFFLNQQDEKKKLLKIEFDFSGNYDDYITKYLPWT